MMQTEQEKEGNEFWRTLLSGGGYIVLCIKPKKYHLTCTIKKPRHYM